MNAYKVLDVAPDASLKAIKSSYIGLALKLHPDKQPPTQNSSEAAAISIRFQQVAEAWEILQDPTKRREHDAYLSNLGRLGPVQDSIDVQAMEYDEGHDVFYSPCRCGGRFEISVSELQGEEEIEAIECSQCSLFVGLNCESSE
ncbi:hypothetical protein BASA50_002049 [Batrachochytrium salamandrivorans]|uniref:Diphthamide biosynthesis protein 4 n=1 Tax=Batrachochytrium salamandrivorans TaxID=1357716 RepID=A0ABQ8FQ82_9FUNG|nr:hypothetical protein BASA62_008355 [Batrachochytrium salamandrivorans]KAH6566276.1 hypothetical protein BASA60_009550 [Batrachochytrium salamandrivorans]KAH6588098.1 hypothetical protein BASA61_006127 [Batrachochytrium salamandrivorans]KAH6600667.1 hypothetical protein BASA50_002049 [Batrachochytrium salamandrivorans]KAJ1332697.1 hypothetical protein BSLG_008326 [Batrachochytrium salamandrivorans]